MYPVCLFALCVVRQGFRGRGGTTTQRLDGAIYAASNAALMLAQLGEEEGALKEVGAPAAGGGGGGVYETLIF